MPPLSRLIQSFKDIRNRFEPEALSKKEILLSAIRQAGSIPLSQWPDLHDTLLFLEAYPHTPAFRQRVIAAQMQVRKQIRASLAGSHPRTQSPLPNSGISGTHIEASLSYELCDWLQQKFPGAVHLQSFGAEQKVLAAVFSTLLHHALRASFQADAVEVWLAEVAGPQASAQLVFLLDLFRQGEMPCGVRSHLFDSLQLVVRADLSRIPSRSDIRALYGAPFFHHDPLLLRRAELRTLLHDALDEPVLLHASHAEKWITAFRLQLLSYGREAAHGRWTDMRHLQLFRVGHGMELLLIPLEVEHRRPFDADIGFMAFKNGLPYAFGETDILGRMARIRIRVFPTFSSGETAWFFGQLLRTCFQVYRPDFFVASAGTDNGEGTAAPDFWFYYKLGFRPASKSLQELAAREFTKQQKDNSHNTSSRVMQRLSGSEMLLLTNHDNGLLDLKFDAAGISRGIEAYIRKRYKGCTPAAQADTRVLLRSLEGLDSLSESQLNLLASGLGLALLAGGGVRRWTYTQKEELVNLLKEKVAGCDSRYAVLLSRHEGLQKLLRRLATA